MGSPRRPVPRTATVLAAAAAILSAGAPAADAAPASGALELIGAPAPVAAPGDLELHFRATSPGTRDLRVVYSVGAVSRQVFGAQGASVTVGAPRLAGPGSLDTIPVPVPAIAQIPPCLRGGYSATIQYPGQVQVVHLPAGVTQTELVVPVHVPAGFAGLPASVSFAASGAVDEADGTDVFAVAKDIPALSPLAVIDLPRTGLAHDAVSLRWAAARAGRARLRGAVSPPRASAVVEFVGRRTRSGAAVLNDQTLAEGSVGASLRHYGQATTDASGRFSAWVRVPRGAAVLARTAPVTGVTLGGASCGAIAPATLAPGAIRS